MSIKILFLSHKFYPDIGGIEANSEILATGFAKAGFKVHLLTWSSDETHKPFPFHIIRQPSMVTIIKEYLWADVVFENNPCMRLSWPGLLIKKPSVVVLNTWLSIGKSISGKIKLRSLKRANRVIAVSEALRVKSWPKAIVIGNPYNVRDFDVIETIDKTRDFVFLGRLVSDKGAALAIEAMDLLRKQKGSEVRSNFTLSIIGDGPERSNLEALVKKLQLENHVQFMGAMRGRELAIQLNRHKYLLVPSVWEEPFGNVVLEGMACGCLPIASNGGGLPDAVGKAGLLFERGEVKGLVDCIQKVLYSPMLDLKLRSQSSIHLAAHSPEVVVRQYLDVLKSVVFE